jgi:hypothetical protein
MPITTQTKTEEQRVLDREIHVHDTGRVFAWQRQDTRGTDSEDLIPEVKTQSKNNSGFSRSAQKVDERGGSKETWGKKRKSSEETPCHSEMIGRCASALGRPCPSRASVAVHSVRITACTHTHIIISWSCSSRSISQPKSTASAWSHRADADLPPFRPEATPPPSLKSRGLD